MPNFQAPRGTQDILPANQAAWQHVLQAARKSAEQFGFSEITTPTYEQIDLFQRAVGQATDIMEKELFLVKGIRSEEFEYALRPEGTAGIVRAFIEHGMHTLPQPVKLWSIVNNFRYDRPQRGRLREHRQFDIEVLGEKGPFADAWVIYTTWHLLHSLGLEGVELQLNTLGTTEERSAYRAALTSYLEPLTEQLSEDSQRRLHSNPLRILDSKDPVDQAAVRNAPTLFDHLGEESKRHFADVQHYLELWNVPFAINQSIVRGLDYYCHTCFEWTTKEAGGQQSSLGGGGRYNGLLPELGGPDIGGVGAGIGLERLLLELEAQGKIPQAKTRPDLALVAADAAGVEALSARIPSILASGQRIEANFAKPSLSSQLKAADKSGARLCVIAGSQEIERGLASVKNLDSGESFTHPLDKLNEL